MPFTGINSQLGSDSLDKEQDMDVHESFAGIPESGEDALGRLAAEAAEDLDFMDDEFINQEDPYLQGLLGPLLDD